MEIVERNADWGAQMIITRLTSTRSSMIQRSACWLLFSIVFAGNVRAADMEPVIIAESPDKKFSVTIQPESESEGSDAYAIRSSSAVVISKDGKPIAKCPTYGYLQNVFWSSTGEYVAINNRRADSGDYLWVFSLPSGECIKQPDDLVGRFLEALALKAFHSMDAGANDTTFIRDNLVGTGWKKGNDFEVQVTAEYYIIRGKAYTHFQYNIVARIIASTFGVVYSSEPKIVK
jgi:hypothetical protein